MKCRRVRQTMGFGYLNKCSLVWALTVAANVTSGIAHAARPCAAPPVVVSPFSVPGQGAPAYAVGADGYLLPPVTIGRDSVRLWAEVRYPADVAADPSGGASGEAVRQGAPVAAAAGALPLVVLLHGNHGIYRTPEGDDVCSQWGSTIETPNHEGYRYLADDLARAGFLTVSINANDLNCKSDRIRERGELVVKHLELWKSLGDASSSPETVGLPFEGRFRGRVDLSNVVLFGHSRGGEGVVHAANLVSDRAMAIRGVYSLAPVDFHGFVLDGEPFMTLLPAADGDVSDLDGARIYDRARGADAQWFKAQLYLHGANHNFFNTEWRDDDGQGDERISAEAQRAHMAFTLRAFAERAVRGNDFVERVAASDVRVDALSGDGAVYSYGRAAGRIVDDFADTDPAVSTAGGAVTAVGLPVFQQAEFRPGTFGPLLSGFLHASRGLALAWDEAGARVDWTLPEEASAVSDVDVLAFRAAQAVDTRTTGASKLALVLAVEDAAGQSHEISTAELGQWVAAPYARSYSRASILQSVRIPRACFAAPSAPLTHARKVSIRWPDRPRGALGLERIEWLP